MIVLRIEQKRDEMRGGEMDFWGLQTSLNIYPRTGTDNAILLKIVVCVDGIHSFLVLWQHQGTI